MAGAYKRFAVKAHVLFVSCFSRVLGAVANGSGTTAASAACRADLDAIATTRIAKARSTARAQVMTRCTGVAPVDVATPCNPGATTVDQVADCVLDAQVRKVSETIAAEYGAACSIATAAGITTLYPGLCATP